jgi:hypothetical protein
VAYDNLTGAAALSHGPGAFVGRDCANYLFAKLAGVLLAVSLMLLSASAGFGPSNTRSIPRR